MRDITEAPEELWESVGGPQRHSFGHAVDNRKAAPSEGTDGGGQPLRVMVVDDDELVRAVVGEMLRAAGHHVEVAAGPQDALALFSSGHFDVVLTDESMPDMLGSELAVQIKASRPETAVVLLTGWGSGLSGAGELPHGIDMILGKPVREDELLACLNGAVIGS